MITQAGLGLDANDERTLSVRDGVFVSRGELRRRADTLLDVLRRRNVRRALICSDDPAHLLRAIDACSRAGIDLYVAHSDLAAEHVESIIESHGIEMCLGEHDSPCASTPTCSCPAGYIFMMTSGTTGLPKIVQHTLDSLLGRVRVTAKCLATRNARWLLTYQSTGFAGVQVILTATLTGGSVISVTQRTPAALYDAARQHRVTGISGTPTFWRAFLMVADPIQVPLRQITLGGEAADQGTLDRLRQAFPLARITHTYASTEAGVVFAVHDGLAGFPRAWLEQGTQGVWLRIRDDLLQIKTPHAMRGYAYEVRRPLLDDGWLSTADRCEVRGNRVYVLGREDSSINVAGSKVYPLAVETVLLALAEVVEARVYGVPNPISGSLVAADVILAAGTDPEVARSSILAACRERLVGYQIPRVLNIVDSIHVRASGKKG